MSRVVSLWTALRGAHSRDPGRPARTSAAVPLLAIALGGPAASAQGLGAALPAARPDAAAASTPAAASATPADELAIEIDRAKEALARLSALADAQTPPPLLEEQRSLLARQVVLLGALQQDRSARRAATTQPLAPPPAALDGPPPHATVDVDTLRDQRDGLVAQRRAIEFSTRALNDQIAALTASRRKAEETLRLRQELLERGRDDVERLRAQAEVARLEVRVSALELARADAERSAGREQLTRLDAAIADIGVRLERVVPRQFIDERALDEVAADAEAARKRIAQQRQRISARLAARAQRLGTGEPEAEQRELAALRAQLIALSELDQVEAGRPEVWRQRRVALEARGDGERQASAATVLRRSIDHLTQRARSLAEQIDRARAAVRHQRLRVEALGADASALADERRALEAMAGEAETLESVAEAQRRLQVLLQRSLDDLGAMHDAGGLREWLARQAGTLRAWTRALWNYELFSASESTQVEGRAVTVDYGVTVGKSIGVLGLFALGFAVARLGTRAALALAVRRLQLSQELAKVLNRWVMSPLMLVLLIGVLKLARVPLTAFAFLGGALAIGVGFGTQTIIKNLISGVIILFERKVRVGDVVTIGGVSGTVASVDLRATTVLGFDGIESMVPNSQLLENRVSNWSYQSRNVRRVLDVGLAYGHDHELAMRAIADCAAAHASVLRMPAPEVMLADFGADALLLRLQYWVRLGGERSGPGVDSDLRRAIAARFEREGLTIAFPQRDVHLDLRAPLEVRLARSKP